MIDKRIEQYIGKHALLNGVPIGVAVGIVVVETEILGGLVQAKYYPEFHEVVDPNSGTRWRTLTKEQYASSTPPEDWDGLVIIGNSPEDEWLGQKSSWGPMQIMGSFARDQGFVGRFTELNGEAGVRFGIAHLKLLQRELATIGGDGWDCAVSAYKGDRHPGMSLLDYSDKVFEACERYNEGLGG